MHVQVIPAGLFAALLVLQALQLVDATCDAKFQIIEDHSACLSVASTASDSGVSEAEKTEIVDQHNYHRANVNPTATDMLKMSWDDEVALVAQAWADNCVYGHDNNYARMIPGRYNAGQNLAASSGGKDWTVIIGYWQSEVAFFEYGVGSTNGSSVGHYTQVVWAKSNKIGCGYAFCSNIFSGGGFYVCNYSPAGNVAPSQFYPYTTGSSCDACPNTCSSNLCDCSSHDCYNYGTIDVDSCDCACRNLASYYVGTACVLNCTGIGNPSCFFTEGQCSVYGNVPYDCPVLCGFCPDGDSTYLLPDSGDDSGEGGNSECYPNGTMVVRNPDPSDYTHVVAVLYEGTSSAEDCSTTISGSSVLIDSCSFFDNELTVHFSNRDASAALDSVFGGSAIKTFTVNCDQIASLGVSRTVEEFLTVSLEATSESSVTPSFQIDMEIRGSSGATASSVSVVDVGDTLTWTIDVPEDYYARPDCTAYPSDGSSTSKSLFIDGCEQDSDLLGDDFTSTDTSVAHTKRYYVTIYAFKFYSSNDVFFQCTVLVCPYSTPCATSCAKRRRSVSNSTSLEPGMQEFSLTRLLHIRPPGSHATTTIGSIWAVAGAVLMALRH